MIWEFFGVEERNKVDEANDNISSSVESSDRGIWALEAWAC